MASNFCRSNKSLLRDSGQWSVILFLKIFFVLGVGFPFYPEIFYISVFIMILQCIRIIVGDAGFEPGTSAPEVMCVTNEPPHLVITIKQYGTCAMYCTCQQCSGVVAVMSRVLLARLKPELSFWAAQPLLVNNLS